MTRVQTSRRETGQVRFSERPLSEIKPSPENDKLYKPVDPQDPEVRALAASIRQYGVKEPLVISLDGYIISGHRRYAAATLARLATVPVRVEPIRRSDDPDAFVVLLREYNRQRVKSHAEKLREEIVSIDATSARRRLVEYRSEKATIPTTPIKLANKKVRSKISDAKMPMLKAIQDIIERQRRFLPLDNRRIHYQLLNDPPLRHASKPDSRYTNDERSYSDLCDLITRARFEGLLPMDAIDDPTRPITTWDVHGDTQTFIRASLRGLLNGYFRNLQQSQTIHIEVLCEKNTIAPICRPICGKYCIPLTSGRGFCSVPPRRDMHERFVASGRERLVVLILSDFDPEGESIAESFARSMRDDFGLEDVHPIKVALTREQATKYELVEDATAKTGSSRYKAFVKKYGEHVWELEALAPELLQELLEEAIISVLDMQAFEVEVDSEAEDARFLEGVRRTVLGALQGIMPEEVEFDGEQS